MCRKGTSQWDWAQESYLFLIIICVTVFWFIQHVVLLAAAKAGFKVVDVDYQLTAIDEIRDFLKSANCKVIYFKPVHENHDYLKLLRQAIPEFFECKIAAIAAFSCGDLR